MYKLYYTNRAKKDAQLIKSSNLKPKAQELLDLIAQDPYAYPPEFEFLKGDLKSAKFYFYDLTSKFNFV